MSNASNAAAAPAHADPANNDVNVKSKKPKDSSFKQQRLPAWQPILTAGTVLPTFFVIGIAFIPIGIGMLWFSQEVMELELDYTDCVNANKDKCSEIVLNSTSEDCSCQLDFTIDEKMEGDVFLYYGLTNFYQNHRRYVKSRDDSQLLGNDIASAPSSDCEPFDKDADGKPYVPCGAIANSMFNDDIVLKWKNPASSAYEVVPMLRKGIAWESDKTYKFKNPPGDLQQALEGTLKPRDWKKNLWELDTEDSTNNGLENEDFIVWMRTAALPNFKKLYRRLNRNNTDFNEGLPKGEYRFEINYNFRVVQFSGTKRAILSTTSLLGGKNPFLGIAYITVGSLCLILGVVFLFIHIKCGKQTSEMLNISSRTAYN